MMDLPDGFSAMSKEEFARKYKDTHAELQFGNMLEKARKTSSLKMKFPDDKNAGAVSKHKKPLERAGFVKRADGFKHYLMDGISVRSEELLSPDSMPFKDLIRIVAGILPREDEVKVQHNHTYADLVLRAYEQNQAKRDAEEAEVVDITPEEDTDANPSSGE